jgi:hypothetical protein
VFILVGPDHSAAGEQAAADTMEAKREPRRPENMQYNIVLMTK